MITPEGETGDKGKEGELSQVEEVGLSEEEKVNPGSHQTNPNAKGFVLIKIPNADGALNTKGITWATVTETEIKCIKTEFKILTIDDAIDESAAASKTGTEEAIPQTETGPEGTEGKGSSISTTASTNDFSFAKKYELPNPKSIRNIANKNGYLMTDADKNAIEALSLVMEAKAAIIDAKAKIASYKEANAAADAAEKEADAAKTAATSIPATATPDEVKSKEEAAKEAAANAKSNKEISDKADSDAKAAIQKANEAAQSAKTAVSNATAFASANTAVASANTAAADATETATKAIAPTTSSAATADAAENDITKAETEITKAETEIKKYLNNQIKEDKIFKIKILKFETKQKFTKYMSITFNIFDDDNNQYEDVESSYIIDKTSYIIGDKDTTYLSSSKKTSKINIPKNLKLWLAADDREIFSFAGGNASTKNRRKISRRYKMTRNNKRKRQQNKKYTRRSISK
jgi:hypothetical protein